MTKRGKKHIRAMPVFCVGDLPNHVDVQVPWGDWLLMFCLLFGRCIIRKFIC